MGNPVDNFGDRAVQFSRWRQRRCFGRRAASPASGPVPDSSHTVCGAMFLVRRVLGIVFQRFFGVVPAICSAPTVVVATSIAVAMRGPS